MFPATFTPMIMKLILPEILKLIKPLRKYVEEPNELDVQMENVEEKCTKIDMKLKVMEEMLKDLDEDSHPPLPFDKRITALEKKIG